MFVKNFCVASLLLPLSSFVAADAYKCEPDIGNVSYQEVSCPKTDEQSIVRINGNSHHIDKNAQVEPNPRLAALIALDRAQELAIRVRDAKRAEAKRLKAEQELMAVALEKQSNCDKFTALYHERVRQQAELISEDSDELRTEVTTEMLDSTRQTMESYCDAVPLVHFYSPSGSQLIY